VVASGLADECEVQLSYTIGLSQPVSIEVETFDKCKVSEEEIIQRIAQNFDFRPAGIIRRFQLHKLPAQSKDGFFQRLATFGHVGRTDLDLPWERIDREL
jgi:S-adenosylmethionine synthetase